MNNIYDNGTSILGSVYNLKEYIAKNCEDMEEVKYLIEELENYDEDTIIAINYDFGMGYRFDYWYKRDMVKGAEL